MAVFILIHGAWHGGWCWERIVPLLSQEGHQVLAPDLPGIGKNNTISLANITLDHWVSYVCELIFKQKEKVILVGHSRGGIVISQAAEQAAEYINGLIYLAAFLLPTGATLLKTMQTNSYSQSRSPTLIFSSNRATSTVALSDIRELFYNKTPEEWQKRAESRMGPEPMISFTTPLKLTKNRFGKVPRTYIECLQDKAIPIDLQRSMVSILPCQKVISLDTDHSPFYSTPTAIAAQLIDMFPK